MESSLVNYSKKCLQTGRNFSQHNLFDSNQSGSIVETPLKQRFSLWLKPYKKPEEQVNPQ